VATSLKITEMSHFNENHVICIKMNFGIFFLTHTVKECFKTWEICPYPSHEHMTFFRDFFTKSTYYK
jgi:hypothetical protein